MTKLVETYSSERQDVWDWLSELFLDTEMLERDKELLAQNLAATSYSVEQLDQIMRAEVAPVLHGNLMVVAGAWGCWNREEEVIKPIAARLNALRNARFKGLPLIQEWMQHFYMMVVQSDWKDILERIAKIRNQADSKR